MCALGNKYCLKKYDNGSKNGSFTFLNKYTKGKEKNTFHVFPLRKGLPVKGQTGHSVTSTYTSFFCKKKKQLEGNLHH